MTSSVRVSFAKRLRRTLLNNHPVDFGANLLVGDYVAPHPGPILEIDTNVQLGQHNGLWTYTIGQGAKLPGLSRKLFVAGKDYQKNAIYVALSESVVAPFTLFCSRIYSIFPS
jgi:tRNA U34 2-thiouridine synthase MnmA/TrmU